MSITKMQRDMILLQIKNIMLNKPIINRFDNDDDELSDLQDAILYLANCLSESQEFLHYLSKGQLDVQPPGRHNFLAGSLKELHADLKHLTWQANQVANGDYNQRVSFLGDFSVSFNRMTELLAQREAQQKEQAQSLAETVDFMVAIMNSQKDWILVKNKETSEIIFANKSANKFFFDADDDNYICDGQCGEQCLLLTQILGIAESTATPVEFSCEQSGNVYSVKPYNIRWNGNMALAYNITDITGEKEYRREMELMVYKDELTGLFNRRYCQKTLTRLLQNKTKFVLCVIDLDGLKVVNDNFGHIYGDEYLKAVAAEIHNATRTADVACRIGGDEFVILFSQCGVATAEKRLEAINIALQNKSTDKVKMNVSYGAIEVNEANTVTPKNLLRKADEKMYEMKNAKKGVVNV